MISKNIASLGLEIECGEDFPDKLDSDIRGYAPFFKRTSDGSVYVKNTRHPHSELLIWHHEKENLFKMLKIIYKSGIKTNGSCGFHVHIKFRNEIWKTLIDRKFSNIFIDKYKSNFIKNNNEKYTYRLHNRYCFRYVPSERTFKRQMEREYKSGVRYSPINFNSMDKMGTVEFRIFPAQGSYTESTRTINWLISTIENYLKETRHIRGMKIPLGRL